MRIVHICIVISFLSGIFYAQNVEAVTRDGKIVVLKENGTWEYKVAKGSEERDTIKKKIDSGKDAPGGVNSLSSFNKKLPFNDFEATVVPSGFLGHDIEEIYEILDRRITNRDEFETTADYTKRIAEAKRVPIYDGLPVDSVLAFVKTPSSPFWSDDITFSSWYDEDKSRLSITVNSGRRSLDYVPIVQVTIYPEKNLMFDNLRPYLSKESRFIKFDFEIEAGRAKELKENLRVMYVFKLKPFQSNSIGRDLDAELTQIWFFSAANSNATTNIAYKFKIGSLRVPNVSK